MLPGLEVSTFLPVDFILRTAYSMWGPSMAPRNPRLTLGLRDREARSREWLISETGITIIGLIWVTCPSLDQS